MEPEILIPKDSTGLSGIRFVVPFFGGSAANPSIIYPEKRSNHLTPLQGRRVSGWLSCSEGWHLRDDGRWHETVNCGWLPGRIADTVEDIINLYRETEPEI